MIPFSRHITLSKRTPELAHHFGNTELYFPCVFFFLSEPALKPSVLLGLGSQITFFSLLNGDGAFAGLQLT